VPVLVVPIIKEKYKVNFIVHPIAFPKHARLQVKGGHSSGEIELIQAGDWLAADSTLDFQRESYACSAIAANINKVFRISRRNLILFTLKSIENN
jgi:hypothetical protein